MTVGAKLSVGIWAPVKPAHTPPRRTRPRPALRRAPRARRARAARGAHAPPPAAGAATGSRERRTTRRARRRPPRRTASGGSAGPACPPARGRQPYRAAAWRRPAPPPRRTRADASWRGLHIGQLFLVLLELDDEPAGDRRRHLEAHAAPGLDVLVHVVAVEVHLVGGVRAHGEIDRLALLPLQVLRAAHGLGVADLDGRRDRQRQQHGALPAAHRYLLVCRWLRSGQRPTAGGARPAPRRASAGAGTAM